MSIRINMDQAVLNYIGNALGNARKDIEAPLSYAETACNLSARSTSKIERGLVDLRVTTFIDLCEAYGISAAALLLESINVREAVREREAGEEADARPAPEAVILWNYTCHVMPDEDIAVLICVDGEDDAREGALSGGRWFWAADTDPSDAIDGYVYAWAELPVAASKARGHLAEWHEQRHAALRRGPVALIAEHAVPRDDDQAARLSAAIDALEAIQVMLTPQATHCHRIIADALKAAKGGA